MCGCSESHKVDKNTNVNIDVINNAGFKSLSAKNGISVKPIPIGNNAYTLQINIDYHTDTLDYYLNSKTAQQSVPKILFGTDYVFFLTGSSSYRYITVAYLDKRFDKIILRKYTTSRDVSSDIDGAIFFKEGYYYLYDLAEHKLNCQHSNFEKDSFNEATIFCGDSILIKGEHGMNKYKKEDFSIKGRLLTPIIAK